MMSTRKLLTSIRIILKTNIDRILLAETIINPQEVQELGLRSVYDPFTISLRSNNKIDKIDFKQNDKLFSSIYYEATAVILIN